MLAYLFTFLSLSLAIIWSMVFLPFSYFGIKVNKIRGNRMNKFLKSVKHSSIWTNDEPDGWICGKWFIGYINTSSSDRKESRDLWLISSEEFYKNKIVEKEVDEEGKSNVINYWVRQGVFWHLEYYSRNLDIPKKTILPHQWDAVMRIMEVYTELKHAVVLLYGKAGGGKSMTAQFLCAELLKSKKVVHFCESHAPYEHGDNFDTFYNKINPTEENPLVLVFEEVDGMILNLHNNRVEQKHHIPVQIKNKTDWNSFLDKFDRDIYPHVILLLTTNKSDKFFDELDPSYLRKGRVNLKIPF